MGGTGHRTLKLASAVAAFALLLPASASASQELIVRYERGADRPELRDAAGVGRADPMLIPRTEVVAPVGRVSREAAIRRLRGLDGVEYVEPVREMELHVDPPDDTFFPLQWALENTGQSVGGLNYGVPGASIAALTAWNVARTSPDVVTAVIDSGVHLGHPDLSSQIWTNPGETPADGIDNDGNGKVDDVNGWDFLGDRPLPVAGSHGTHVAGIVGATAGNGTGTSGVSQDATLMTLAACTDSSCNSSRVADAAEYARLEGAKVVNLSLGGTSRSPTLRAVMEAAPDVLFVTSAGNDGHDLDATPQYPCMEDVSTLLPTPKPPLGNVICVASSDLDDGKAESSNYGATGVDLAAPGVAILSTVPSGNYSYKSGTSMAAPQVAGAASLLRQAEPGLSVAQVKQRILASVEPAPEFSTPFPTVTGGRLDLTRLFAAGLQVPKLVAPADGAILNEAPLLRWTTPETRLRYTVEVDGEEAYSVPGLSNYRPYWLGPGTHTWQVHAVEMGNDSVVSSEERSFTIVERAARIRLLKVRPANDRQGGVRVRARISGAGKVRVLVRPRSGPSKKILARGSASRSSAGMVTIRARLTKAGRRATSKRKRLGVRLNVVFRPTTGPVRTLARRAVISAPKSRTKKR